MTTDALVRNIRDLKNDGWANIEGFSDRFRADKHCHRVEIEIPVSRWKDRVGQMQWG